MTDEKTTNGAASELSDVLGLRFEQQRDGRLAALEALAIVETENRRLLDIIGEVHSWAVCACIATPEEMMQNISRIVEITRPNVELTGAAPTGGN